MGYFEERRPSWNFRPEDNTGGQDIIYKADGEDDSECRFHERMKGRRFCEPSDGFAQANIVYPFIDRHLKISEWTRQDDGSFVFTINGKNAVITFEDGQALALRWDGVQIYVDSLYALEGFLL